MRPDTGEDFNPLRTATLKLSDWLVILDALEEWASLNETADMETQIVRGKIPTDAIQAWLSNRNTPVEAAPNPISFDSEPVPIRSGPLVHRYYLRERPQTLCRVETGSDRVEVWSADGWQATSLSAAEFGGDAYRQVNPKDVIDLTAFWSE